MARKRKSRARRGDGYYQKRGPETWRLRYRLKGKRYEVTFHGSEDEAKIELRRLLRSGDTGSHVEPHRVTLTQWIDEWIATGAPGRRTRKNKIRQRTIDRYAELLRCH